MIFIEESVLFNPVTRFNFNVNILTAQLPVVCILSKQIRIYTTCNIFLVHQKHYKKCFFYQIYVVI